MKFSGFLLATAGGVAVSSGAQAADLPLKAIRAPAYVPAASWAGPYIGVHVGAAWQQAQVRDSYDNGTATDNGIMGGGQAGYNWQDGNFVYGIEVDGSGLDGSPDNTFFADPYHGNDVQRSKIEWLVTLRGRMGLAVGNTMAYATGGLAIGGVKTEFGLDGSCTHCNIVSNNDTRVGWVVGGGIEHMFNPNWTVGLEGLFVDLGDQTLSGTKSSPFKVSNQAVIGRFKANYKW
jgi:outer membrane immunogenic protein